MSKKLFEKWYFMGWFLCVTRVVGFKIVVGHTSFNAKMDWPNLE